MSKGIFVPDKEYTFQEAAHLLKWAILSITDEDTEAVFSIADLLCLLRSVNVYVPGEFDIQQTRSHYYKIIYKSEDEVIRSFKDKWEGFTA